MPRGGVTREGLGAEGQPAQLQGLNFTLGGWKGGFSRHLSPCPANTGSRRPGLACVFRIPDEVPTRCTANIPTQRAPPSSALSPFCFSYDAS